MAFKLTLPRLGLTMEVGTVVEWFKKEGDSVNPGDRIFAVETDKAVQDYEAAETGILHLRPDLINKATPFELKVDEFIGYLLNAGESVPADLGAADGTPAASTAEAVSAVAAPAAGAASAGSYKASPLARKLAEQNNIDLSTIVPEDGDKIQRKDVEKAIAERAAPAPKAAPVAAPAAAAATTPAAPVAAPMSAPLVGQAVPMSQIRRVIAQRMAESAQTTAAVTVMTEADATKLVEFREQAKASLQAAGQSVPSYTDLIVKLTALALREHPDLNAVLAGDEIIRIADVHIAVAVDTDAGLLVPVVRDVLRKSVYEISNDTRTLADKARERKIGPDDLQGGTFTITNLGNYGVDGFTPIINLPQVAILGIGRIVGKPAEWQGQIALRKLLTLSLTFDHRVVDGGPAARFLNRVRQYVEDPHLWLLR
ncbi:MAG: dihydrolipoamide acetyltransferase family protein [Chloroflexota bacterium]